MADYWACCFYSDYRLPNGLVDPALIKGPPFLEFPCPSSFLGEDWTASVAKTRLSLMSKHKLKSDADLIGWFADIEAATEVGAVAIDEVRVLNLPESYAMGWVCCFLPDGAKWMANRAVSVLTRFPHFADRRQFRCSREPQRSRVRASPFTIDWSQGANEKFRKAPALWDLKERGIELTLEEDGSGNMRMSLSWRPELVRIDELRKAAEYAHRYYERDWKRNSRLQHYAPW